VQIVSDRSLVDEGDVPCWEGLLGAAFGDFAELLRVVLTMQATKDASTCETKEKY